MKGLRANHTLEQEAAWAPIGLSTEVGKRTISSWSSFYTLFQNGAHSEKSWGEQPDNEASRANSVSSDVYCMLADNHVSKLLSFFARKSLTSRIIVKLLHWDAWPSMPRPHVTLPSTFPSGRHFWNKVYWPNIYWQYWCELKSLLYQATYVPGTAQLIRQSNAKPFDENDETLLEVRTCQTSRLCCISANPFDRFLHFAPGLCDLLRSGHTQHHDLRPDGARESQAAGRYRGEQLWADTPLLRAN